MLEAVLVDVDAESSATGSSRSGTSGGIDVPLKVLVLAVPRDHPADRRVRPQHPRRQPARRRRGLHPGVRRRALVGAGPAQPDRAAAQGPAAVHARGDGDLGALPAALLGGRQAAGRARRSTRSVPGRTPGPGAADRTSDAPVTRDVAGGGSPDPWPSPVGGVRGARDRSPTAASSWPATRAGGLRPARAARGARGRRGHRGRRGRPVPARRRGRGARAVAGPGRAAVPLRRPGPLRRLRLPARRRSPAQRRAQGGGRRRAAAPAGRASTWTARSRRCPATRTGCGWRTRVQWAVDRRRHGRALRKHRSHDVVPVDDCRIAHPRLPDVRRRSRGRTRRRPRRSSPRPATGAAGRQPGGAVATAAGAHEQAAGRRWRCTGRLLAGAPGAPRTPWSRAVLDGLGAAAGGAGARPVLPGWGCSRAALADAVGPTGSVVAVESRPERRRGRRGATWPTCRRSRCVAGPGGPGARRTVAGAADLVVLDPPRTGARRDGRRGDRARWPRGRSPTSPATRRRWRATWRYFAEHGYGLGLAAGLRPVPDDAPRRVRRRAAPSDRRCILTSRDLALVAARPWVRRLGQDVTRRSVDDRRAWYLDVKRLDR